MLKFLSERGPVVKILYRDDSKACVYCQHANQPDHRFEDITNPVNHGQAGVNWSIKINSTVISVKYVGCLVDVDDLGGVTLGKQERRWRSQDPCQSSWKDQVIEGRARNYGTLSGDKEMSGNTTVTNESRY